MLLFWWPLESECTVCYCHVTYGFQSEYTLFSSLNVKEHLPRKRHDIWSLSEYGTDRYSQRQANHLASLVKALSVRLRPKWLWFWIPLLLHIVLCLNAFAKLQNARGAPRQPVLMGKCPTCLYVLALSVYWMFYYQSFSGGVQGMRLCGHLRGGSWEESWHEINEVNVLRNIPSMTKKGDDIPTH